MFNVPVIGCKNSVVYIQQSINNILRPLREFVRAYIDDIISGACSFSRHVTNLQVIFDLCIQYNISIKLTKVFFNYFSVNLLGQHVNSLGLTTVKDKLAAIAAVEYLTMLGDLEYFLSLTSYSYLSVHCYAQIAMLLQDLKTFLLKSMPIAGEQHKAFVSKTKLFMPTDTKLVSFQILKDALLQAVTLVYYLPDCVL